MIVERNRHKTPTTAERAGKHTSPKTIATGETGSVRKQH